LPVVSYLRERLPNVPFILCADDDIKTEGNPGLTKATAAARAVDGVVARPDFGTDRPEGATDFNDLGALLGLAAVKAAIENAEGPRSVGETRAAPEESRQAEPDKDAVQERAAIQAPTPYQTSRQQLGAVSMANVRPEAVQRLWHCRIPRRKLTLIDGDPGLGKSFVTLAIATAVNLGHGLPGEAPTEAGRVLLLSAEDGLGHTIRTRLDKMGADCRMITAISEHVSLDPAGCQAIDNILEIEKPQLVIIDPLFAYTGATVNIHKANEVRAIMVRLMKLAEKTQLCDRLRPPSDQGWPRQEHLSRPGQH
jgi:putative DNA primase/helicase